MKTTTVLLVSQTRMLDSSLPAGGRLLLVHLQLVANRALTVAWRWLVHGPSALELPAKQEAFDEAA